MVNNLLSLSRKSVKTQLIVCQYIVWDECQGNIACSSPIHSWHSANTSWSIGRHLTIAQLSTNCQQTVNQLSTECDPNVNQCIVWLSMNFWPIYWPTYWLRVCTENMIENNLTSTFSEIAKRYAASLSVQSPSRKLYVFVPAQNIN